MLDAQVETRTAWRTKLSNPPFSPPLTEPIPTCVGHLMLHPPSSQHSVQIDWSYYKMKSLLGLGDEIHWRSLKYANVTARHLRAAPLQPSLNWQAMLATSRQVGMGQEWTLDGRFGPQNGSFMCLSSCWPDSKFEPSIFGCWCMSVYPCRSVRKLYQL